MPVHPNTPPISPAPVPETHPARRPLADGLSCSPIGFGCWRFTHGDTRQAQAVVEAALDAGMDLIDTADVYGLDWGGTGFGSVEELLGQVLRAAPHLRDRMVLATKGGIRPPVPYDSSPDSLRAACEASLRRLGVEHIDLYQVHRPDLFTHPHDVADTLAALHAEGKVGAVGISNHTPWQHLALHGALEERGLRVASTQVEYSAAHLEPLRDGTFDVAMSTGAATMAWSPLVGGRIVTGEGMPPALLAVLDELAADRGVDRATVALAFALAHPSRPIVLVGSQDPARIGAATRALTVTLDRTDLYRIVVASEGRPLP
jgi:aryl-alcohol dehydrogenase-like predicted oxidoreductase